jgi:chemotaxis protein histidine kinase CheA
MATVFQVVYFSTAKNSMMSKDLKTLGEAQRSAKAFSKLEDTKDSKASVGQYVSEEDEDPTKTWTYVNGTLVGSKVAGKETMTETAVNATEAQDASPETEAPEVAAEAPKPAKARKAKAEKAPKATKAPKAPKAAKAPKEARVANEHGVTYGANTNRTKLLNAFLKNLDDYVPVEDLAEALYGENGRDKRSPLMMVLNAIKYDADHGVLKYELRKSKNGKEISFGLFRTKE